MKFYRQLSDIKTQDLVCRVAVLSSVSGLIVRSDELNSVFVPAKHRLQTNFGQNTKTMLKIKHQYRNHCSLCSSDEPESIIAFWRFSVPKDFQLHDRVLNTKGLGYLNSAWAAAERALQPSLGLPSSEPNPGIPETPSQFSKLDDCQECSNSSAHLQNKQTGPLVTKRDFREKVVADWLLWNGYIFMW